MTTWAEHQQSKQTSTDLLATAASIGTPLNANGTATLAGILGDPSNITLAAQLASLGGRVVHKSITYIPATTSYAAFTVSNVCAVKIIGVVTGPLTTHADETSVGTTTGGVAGILPATAASALTSSLIWVDATPSKFETFPAAWTLVNETITVTSTINIVGGVISLYCFYIPIASGAVVAAAA